MSRAQRWTVWTIRNNPEPGKKPSKVPVANPTDPSTWCFFPTARSLIIDEPKIAGLGFEMYGRPEVIGVDIDNCINELNQRSPTAAQFLAILEANKTRCHVEISPSGKGLRIFAGETPTPFHDFTNKDTGVECYTGEAGRFLAFTGHMVPGFGEGPFDPLPPDAVEWLRKHAKKMKEGKDGPVDPDALPPVDPLPDLSRRDDWQKLYPKIYKRLSKDHKTFLDTGALGDRYSSASEHLFAVEQTLLRLGLKPAQAYQVLISADGAFNTALDHREGKAGKAKEFIWDDLQRASKSKERHEKEKAQTDAGWKDCNIVVEVTDEGAKAKWLALNILNTFKLHPEWINRLGYNTFDGRPTLDKKDIEAEELINMSAWLVEFLKWSAEPRREVFEEALTAAAKARPFNPVEDELRGLIWDGKPRLKAFTEAIVESPGEVDRQILRKWLIAYVARGMKPGCQMDSILVLRERVGGGFKTALCRLLSRGRFSDTPGFAADRESSMLREGARIIELGEGVAAQKSSRHEFKRDATKREDQFRRPWGRGVETRLRGFLYIVTVNDFAFMRSDQDGLRRIWPINCKPEIDIEWIKENLDQIVAEAVTWWEAGEEWWWKKGQEPEALVERQGASVAEDPLDEAVHAVICDKENAKRGYVTLTELKRQVEGVAGLSLNAGQVNHLIDIASKAGFSSHQRRIGGRKMRPWTHPTWAPLEGGRLLELRATGAGEGDEETGT